MTASRANRRHVLKGAAAAVVFPAIVPASALGRVRGVAAASERIGLGVIGIGPRGTYDLKAMLKEPDVRCVAVCDVQRGRREAAKGLVDGAYGDGACAMHRDFRELLDRKDVDAVLIATGDRWHAPASILAANAGKDVYSEKPCGLTIALCQRLDEVMRETKRIFQAGTQRRSVANFQTAVSLARSGKLGKLQRLYASVYVPAVETAWLPRESTPPREEVDWEMWLGPAPWRPYNRKYVEGGWRGQWDFDSGARLLDWGAHTVDLCQQANDADATMPVEYTPSETKVTAKYANGVTLILDFLRTPFGERPGWVQELGTCPVRFEGSEGTVEAGDGGGIVAHPEALQSELAASQAVADGLDVSAHARNFFDAIKTRGTTAANSAIMRKSHIACHAAALSWLLGRTLRIDPATETFVDDEEANGLRERPLRGQWGKAWG
jgi:predicted dehydrogenase